MKELKKIILRVVLVIILLVAFNWIYEAFFFEKDIREHSDIVDLVTDIPNDASILYVAESSNNATRKDDNDKRHLHAFVGDYFPDLVVADITQPAGHAGIFLELLRIIPDTSSIKTIVMTVNLRSFGANWIYSDMETSLRKSFVLLEDNPPLMNRFKLTFKDYDVKTASEREEQFRKKWDTDTLIFPYEFMHKTVNEWDYGMACTGIRNADGEIDHELTSLACHYIKAYAFQIDTLTNPRIHDFNSIIDLAKQRGWNLVFNLLAENTEKANELIECDIVYLMEQNRNLLIDYYARKGIVVIDNLHEVESNQFIDQDWTTEHYAEKGRRAIAKNVAHAIKQYHTDSFVAH